MKSKLENLWGQTLLIAIIYIGVWILESIFVGSKIDDTPELILSIAEIILRFIFYIWFLRSVIYVIDKEIKREKNETS